MTNGSAVAQAYLPLFAFHLLEWLDVPFSLDIGCAPHPPHSTIAPAADFLFPIRRLLCGIIRQRNQCQVVRA